MNQKQFLESGNYLLDEVKSRAEKHKSHFFDTDTMRFFSSRISELCWEIGNDIIFITSENQGYGHDRFWTVRKIDIDGDITTIGDFQEHENLNEARKTIKEAVQN